MVRRDSHAGVPDSNHHGVWRGGPTFDGEPDLPALCRELRGVVEQVAEDLLQPEDVAFQVDRLGRKGEGEGLAACLEVVLARLDDPLDDRQEVDRLLVKGDPSLRYPGDVEEIVDQPRQALDLVAHDLPSPVERGGGHRRLPHDFHGIAEGSQGIAELVRQHGQESVLVPVGRQELLGALP